MTMCCIHPQCTVSQNDLLTSVSQSHLAAAKCVPPHARLSGLLYKGITKILCVLDGISDRKQCRCTSDKMNLSISEYVVGTFSAVKQHNLEGTKVLERILNNLIVFLVRSICYDFCFIFYMNSFVHIPKLAEMHNTAS